MITFKLSLCVEEVVISDQFSENPGLFIAVIIL